MTLKLIGSYAAKCWGEMAGVANRAGERKVFKFITFSRDADWAMTLPTI